ncbi:MAG: N-acetyltransferase DgcN [Rhodospirillales bacterium]
MLKSPYLLFIGNAADPLAAKTAAGIVQWRPEWCLGQTRLPGCRANLALPDMTPEEAAAAGAATMIVGVANAGGFIPEAWTEMLVRALRAGLDVASGLHDRLDDIPAVAEEAARLGRALHDVRHPKRTFSVGTGEPRSGRRLLTVGTDCSVGKMYASLALTRAMRARGLDADFRATGQTGIFIAGEGVSVDAVVADFIAGATEWLSPAADPQHWDVIEGQGSLFHPSYAGVSLGLLHGAQAEALVMCHEPTRSHMRGLPNRPLPDIAACITANEQAARLTDPRATCIGVCINTGGLGRDAGDGLLVQLNQRLGLPCVDPLVHGVEAIIDKLV